MDSTHWRELKLLFTAAMELSPEERARYLDEACGTNQTLRANANSLLEAHDSASDYLESLTTKLFHNHSDTVSDILIENDGMIAQYQVLEKLGSGGMGIVYKAFDTKLERTVALKFLPPYLKADRKAKASLIHEAKAASSLNHPNIATIHEIGGTENQLLIAMEYCEGQTLKSIISEDQLTLERCVNIACQIGEGLAKAHAKGIIHRDVKPANIIVDEENLVKVIDFGLAHSSREETAKGVIQGTVAYMSPEQAQGNPLDERSDIWSFGVVLYEALTGIRPFQGKSDRDTLASICQSPPKPVVSLRVDIPQALHNLVHRALQKKVDDRYQSMKLLLQDLLKVQAELLEQKSIDVGHDQIEPVSIAVLPFTDLSAAKNQEYFSDGITEEINDALARVKGWRVAARTSTFSFKGHKEDVRSVGKQLNVSYILEGSVRVEASKVRISAQLVNVKDGFLIWSEHYHRELDDVFSIQADIAHTIAHKLQYKFEGKEALIRPHTPNQEAYHMYLQARFFFNKRTYDGVQKGKRLFEQALALDPLYAQAHAGLADCYVMLSFQGALSPREAMPTARTAASKALSIDPSIAEAYTSTGCIQAIYEWDWKGANASFEEALSINPSYATAYHWYTIWCLLPTGQFKKGRAILKRAQALDPFSIIQNTAMGWFHYFAREYDQSIRILNHTLQLAPSFPIAHEILGQVYLQKGWAEKALYELREAVNLSQRRTLSLSSLGHALAVTGERKEALSIVKELEQRSINTYVSQYDLALISTGLGDKKQALEYLKEALDERSGWLCFLNIEPRFDSLRTDQQFTTLLRTINEHIH